MIHTFTTKCGALIGIYTPDMEKTKCKWCMSLTHTTVGPVIGARIVYWPIKREVTETWFFCETHKHHAQESQAATAKWCGTDNSHYEIVIFGPHVPMLFHRSDP